MLFGVKPTDFSSFLLVVLTLSLVALASCYAPARSAMKTEPAIALREE
jgi:ABC-type lipoprotein release transport system permease subunit